MGILRDVLKNFATTNLWSCGLQKTVQMGAFGLFDRILACTIPAPVFDFFS